MGNKDNFIHPIKYILYRNVLTRKITVDLMSNKRRSSEGVRTSILLKTTTRRLSVWRFMNRSGEINKNKGTSFPKTFRPKPLTKRVRCGNCGQNFRRNTVKPWTILNALLS